MFQAEVEEISSTLGRDGVEALAHSLTLTLTLLKVVHGFWVPMSLAFSGSRCDVIDKLCAQQLEVGRQAGCW